MRQGLNYNHLESFLRVAHFLSFSKASDELKIAQPAISKQIKSLEEFFGEQLLIRNRQQVSLTVFGKRIVTELGGLHHEIGQRVQDTKGDSDVLEGEVRFGCLSEVGEKLFIGALNSFKRKNPSLKVHTQFLKGNQIIQKLKEGSLDIGVVADKVILEGVRCYKLMDEEIIMIGNSRAKINPKDKLSSLPFVGHSQDDPLLMAYLQKFGPRFQGQKLNFEFIVNSHRAMIDIVKKHPFFCVVPKISVEKELKTQAIKQVGKQSLKSSLYLIHLEQEFPDRRRETLSTYLRKYDYLS